MRFTIPAVILSVAGLAGCQPASPLVDTSGVREATYLEVQSCTPLSVITTTTGVSGALTREKALEFARNETKDKAAKAGADTVVYENGAPGSDDLFVRAATYRCS